MRLTRLFGLVAGLAALAGCAGEPADRPARASGFVEATDVRLAAKVGGRVLEVRAVEGGRVDVGQVVVVLETTDVDLALRRVAAEHAQAVAALRLIEAGTRPAELRQADAQLAAVRSDRQAAQSELEAAQADADRYERLVQSRAGAEKARDDALARRNLARARVQAADDRIRAAEATLANLQAGARPPEIAAARARIAVVEAQQARLEQDRADAVVVAPSAGVVTSRLVEPGEIVPPGAPLVVIVDLDRAWANVYVEEPLVPSLRLDGPATVITDGGDRLDGRIGFISPRAEFTPRNVQTADERARLVYRVKVMVDNRQGILKPGMPVEAEFGPQ
ncbi:MAG TPA: HlyD family efflux transporter periplasmic adaptor subunit [Vicinamibacterales bacterium]|nr:HlyD family efflux transporter periplasmic adaptor subunit [Vicinamibacterales bacterium]